MSRVVAVLLVCVGVSSTGAAQQSEAARKALESAAAKGSAPAQYALGAAAEADGDFAHALELYQRAAEQNYAAAQFKLGELFENGKGVDADKAQAIEWYRKASAQGLALATERLQALDPTTVVPPTMPTTSTLTQPLPAAAPVEQPPTPTPTTEPERPSVPTTVAPSPVAPEATATAASSQRSQDDLLAWWTLYVFVSWFCGWRVVRHKLMTWYRSRDFVLITDSVQEQFLFPFHTRMMIEGKSISFGFFVGIFGGNIYFIVTRLFRLTRWLVRRGQTSPDTAEIG